MGPSGSGKTTLLDVLAGRKTAGRTSGSILFAGAPPTVMFLRRYTGYVEQFGEQQLTALALACWEWSCLSCLSAQASAPRSTGACSDLLLQAS